MLADSAPNNIFNDSDLVVLSGNKEAIDWIPESSYRIPSTTASLPSASEGRKSMSDVQESAQILGGENMPIQMLRSMITGSAAKVKSDGKKLVVQTLAKCQCDCLFQTPVFIAAHSS